MPHMVLVPAHPSGMKTASATKGPTTRSEVTMRAAVRGLGGVVSKLGWSEASASRGAGHSRARSAPRCPLRARHGSVGNSTVGAFRVTGVQGDTFDFMLPPVSETRGAALNSGRDPGPGANPARKRAEEPMFGARRHQEVR